MERQVPHSHGYRATEGNGLAIELPWRTVLTRNVRLVFWAAGGLAVALALAIGPLLAGYALAGASLAFIAVLMGLRVLRAVGDWRLEHPWKFGHRRTRSTPAAGEHRRAA